MFVGRGGQTSKRHLERGGKGNWLEVFVIVRGWDRVRTPNVGAHGTRGQSIWAFLSASPDAGRRLKHCQAVKHQKLEPDSSLQVCTNLPKQCIYGSERGFWQAGMCFICCNAQKSTSTFRHPFRKGTSTNVFMFNFLWFFKKNKKQNK